MSGRIFALAAAALFALPMTAFAGPKPLADQPGYKDPALFSRMPNYFLSFPSSFREVQFDRYEFKVGKDAKKPEKVPVEGRFIYYRYAFDKTRGAVASPLQIFRNYQEAAKRLGGEVLFEDKHMTTLRVARDGQESWVELKEGYGGKEYYLTIIERQAMKQDVVGNAEAFRTGLAQTGHVEVPGILFDTGKSEVKPESDAALAEVAKMLKADPSLKVWVVGHTDNVGSASSNLTLSSARAAAVVKALVQKHSVDASRLSAFGNGPYAPVAANGSEDGRARNRRVELVAQ